MAIRLVQMVGILVLAGLCYFLVLTPMMGADQIRANHVDVYGDEVDRVNLSGEDPNADLTWAEADKTLDEGYSIRTDAEIAKEQSRVEMHIALTAAAREDCMELNNCFAPSGTIAVSPEFGGAYGLGMLALGAIVIFFIAFFLKMIKVW